MIRTLTLVGTALAAALLGASATAEPRVLAYGDSNTWGWVPSPEGYPAERHPDDVRWPGVMEAALEAALGEDVTVVVGGLSSRTVATPYPEPVNGISGEAFAGLPDIAAAVASELPLDLVVVMLGTNDARSDVASEPEAVGRDLTALVSRIRETAGGVATPYPAPAVLVVAPPAIGDTSATPIAANTEGSDPRSEAIADAIVAAGAHEGFPVLDARAVVTVDSVDGVHLTAAMHEALGRAVAERVAQLIHHDHSITETNW